MFEVYRDPEGVMLRENPEIKPYFYDIDPEVAARAFHGTSHSPEVRGSRLRSDYALILLGDKQKVIRSLNNAKANGADIKGDIDEAVTHWFNGYREALKQQFLAYCQVRSRCMSTMICGPANFPVDRARKFNDAEQRSWEQVEDFRKKAQKSFLRDMLPYGDGTAVKTADPNAQDKLRAKIKHLEDSKEIMKAANKIIRKHYKDESKVTPDTKAACIAELKAGPMHNLSEAKIAIVVDKDFAGRRGFASYQLSNTGAEIRRLKSRIKEVEQTQSFEINDEFGSEISVCISSDNKIEIHFNFKPDEDTRSKLGSHSFKWSRQRVAWVRMLTENAFYTYQRSVKPILAQLADTENV